MAARSEVRVGGIDVGRYTSDQRALSQIQSTYGTLQAGQLQAIRKPYYSYIQYPAAGATEITFFGNAVGAAGQNAQLTNLPVQGSFGTSSFLVKRIRAKYFIPNRFNATYDGLNANNLAAEFLAGFFQTGYFELNINAVTYVEMTKPWFNLPPADGRAELVSDGLIDANTGRLPNVDLCRKWNSAYTVDPELFIDVQQTFNARITWPSGVVPILSTGLVTAGLAIYVGISLDGVEFRPVQ